MEWYSVVTLFGAYRRTWIESSAQTLWLTHEKEEKDHEDGQMKSEYMLYRNRRYLSMAKEYKRQVAEHQKELLRIERDIDILAGKVTDLIVRHEVQGLVDTSIRAEVREEVFQRSCDAQALSEGNQLLSEETAEWALETSLEQTYEFYVGALVRNMWSKPECQEGRFRSLKILLEDTYCLFFSQYSLRHRTCYLYCHMNF